MTYMVETLQFSDEAVETFTNIILHSDASDEAKRNILEKSVSYLDSKGYFSFSLHSENITCS